LLEAAEEGIVFYKSLLKPVAKACD